MSKDSLSGLPDNLRAMLKADAEASEITRWKPDSEKYLYGEVVKYTFPVGKNGQFSVVVLKTEEGLFSFVANKVIRGKLLDAKVQLGDEVVINPLGMAPGGWWRYSLGVTYHGDRDPAAAYTGTPPGEEPDPEVLRQVDGRSTGDPWGM